MLNDLVIQGLPSCTRETARPDSGCQELRHVQNDDKTRTEAC